MCRTDFLPFTSHIVEHSRYLPIGCQSGGKLAEGSDKSVPRIGNQAQGWDKKEFLRPVPLLEGNIQDKGWKFVMHLSHEKWCVVSR
jgi:hypothetical protein